MNEAAIRNRGLAIIFGTALILDACGTSGPSNGISAPTSPSPPSLPSIGPVSATPTGTPVLEIDSLPEASFDPETLTAVCDPEAGQTNMEAGEATIHCSDGLEKGLRAISTVVSGPIERLYFSRPICRATPCTDDELSTATVTAWTASEAFSVVVDSRQRTVRMPTRDTSAAWPGAPVSIAPAVGRLLIEGAPDEIARRTPYPLCGRTEIGRPASAMACFQAAVLAGRPAELLDRVYGTEGGEIKLLYRFDGGGAILRYTQDSGGWLRQAGSMILGVTPNGWSFDPWWGTDQPL